MHANFLRFSTQQQPSPADSTIVIGRQNASNPAVKMPEAQNGENARINPQSMANATKKGRYCVGGNQSINHSALSALFNSRPSIFHIELSFFFFNRTTKSFATAFASSSPNFSIRLLLSVVASASPITIAKCMCASFRNSVANVDPTIRFGAQFEHRPGVQQRAKPSTSEWRLLPATKRIVILTSSKWPTASTIFRVLWCRTNSCSNTTAG